MVSRRKALFAAASLLAVALASAPADASPLKARHPKTAASGGGGGGSSPEAFPGSADITVFTIPATTHYGSPGDTGYDVKGHGRWDDIPLVEVGKPGVNGNRHIGILCAHEATDAEMASGLASNVNSVKITVDGGTPVTITGKTVNPDAGGYTDWNFQVNSQNFADGLHRVDAECIPATGPSIHMIGPLEDANHFAPAIRVLGLEFNDGSGSAGNVMTVGDVKLTGSISGATLTTTAITNLNVADLAQPAGSGSTVRATGTGITGTPNIIAYLTGRGSTGTYTIDGAAQLVAPTAMVFKFDCAHTCIDWASSPSVKIDNGSGGAGNILTILSPTVNLQVPSLISYSIGCAGCAAGTYIDSVISATNGIGTFHLTVSQTVGGPATFYGASIKNTESTIGSGSLVKGWSVTAVGTGPNTFIDKTNAEDSTYTGKGGAGTYHVTGNAILTANTPGVIGNERSFYFVTDFHSSLRGVGKKTVAYLSKAGSDANDGLAPTNLGGGVGPKLTTIAARGVIRSQDPINNGKYGGIVCVVGGGHWTTDSGTGPGDPTTLLGWLKWEGANGPDCNVASDPGDPIFDFNVTDRTYGPLRTWFSWWKFDLSGPSTFNPGVNSQLVVEHSKASSDLYGGGILGFGGIACLEVQVFGGTGGCVAPMVRNSTFTYHSTDTIHASEFVIGSTGIGGGPVMTYTLGSVISGQSTITGVSVPTGYSIGDFFKRTTGKFCAADNIGCIGLVDTVGLANCFPDDAGHTDTISTTITAFDDTAHTITVNHPATCSVTNGFLETPGNHGDIAQLQIGMVAGDVIYENNSFGATFPGQQQGWFLEASHVQNVYLGGNLWKNAFTPESIISVNGLNQNQIFDHNTWTTTGSFGLDRQFPSDTTTMVGDTCSSANPAGFTGLGTGSSTNVRRKAATSGTTCYTTAP